MRLAAAAIRAHKQARTFTTGAEFATSRITQPTHSTPRELAYMFNYMYGYEVKQSLLVSLSAQETDSLFSSHHTKASSLINRVFKDSPANKRTQTC
jgi:hypothetical protein